MTAAGRRGKVPSLLLPCEAFLPVFSGFFPVFSGGTSSQNQRKRKRQGHTTGADQGGTEGGMERERENRNRNQGGGTKE